MKGSSSAWSTPPNARRTGKPSPSKPVGPVVTDLTGRSIVPTAIGSRRGNASVLATVSAGTALRSPGVWVKPPDGRPYSEAPRIRVPDRGCVGDSHLGGPSRSGRDRSTSPGPNPCSRIGRPRRHCGGGATRKSASGTVEPWGTVISRNGQIDARGRCAHVGKDRFHRTRDHGRRYGFQP